MLSSFLYRNEIKQFTLDLEVLQQVNSFDVEMNASCHNDDRNKVLILSSCCISVCGPHQRVIGLLTKPSVV